MKSKAELKSFLKKLVCDSVLYVGKDDNRVHFILRDAQHLEWFLCMVYGVPHFLKRYVAHDVMLLLLLLF